MALQVASRRRSLAVVAATAGLAVTASACGESSRPAAAERTGPPLIVVTYTVLGSLVRDAVGDAAEVKVLIPDGSDPHEWEPSAKDIEAVNDADLVVRNGLDLEAGLTDALDTADDDGVPTFVATDHITLRTIGEGDPAATDQHGDEHGHGDEGHGDEAHGDEHGHDEHGHGDGTQDPHLWMDPIAMRDVITALGPALAEVGIDADAGVARVVASLTELDETVRGILAVVPEADRQLVTGHESLGYLADRYGFELVGAIIPSITSQAQVSSGDLAELATRIEEAGVQAIFTETGTSPEVAEAIASETGAEVVELASHNLPDDGSYASFMTGNAEKIAAALT